MNGTNGLILLASTACCVIACGEDAEKGSSRGGQPQPEQTILKGHAVFGHEVRTIRPCGDEEALWAIDSTQLLWDLHGGSVQKFSYLFWLL